jgi:2-polyprenyl-6-methoxyphenol hydroxylase-like FAD-dependent oxidoreductase
MYAVYIGPMGDRKLSGKDKVDDFLACCKATGAPAEWYDGISVAGPLAEFEGADSWVSSPGKPGLALIGDAAAATDPSWGNGLSKTLVDVETLAKHLTATDDWNTAVQRYAAEHDDYSGKLRNILGWMTELVWSGGPEADARRERVFPAMQKDPTGYPDPIGMGPFGPSDENARRLILGLA